MKKMKTNKGFKQALIAVAMTVLLLTVCLAVSCDGISNKISEITGVKYENGVISWDKSQAAETYNIVVDGVKQLTTKDSHYVIAASEEELTDDIDVTIEGVNGSNEVVEKKDFSFYVLPTMTVEIVDGYFDWSMTAYTLADYISEGLSIEYELVYDGAALQEPISESKYLVAAGIHTLRVRPIIVDSTLFYSNYSNEAKTYVLTTPENISYEDGYITWSQSDFYGYDVCYKVTINDTVYDDITTNYISLAKIEQADTVSVKVQAVSKEKGLESSEVSAVKVFKQIDPVDGSTLKIVDGVLCWAAVDGAKGYQLELDGVILPDLVTSNSYPGLAPNKSYSISIRTVAEGADESFSSWCEQMLVTVLPSPQVRVEDSLILWEEIRNADSYQVSLTRVTEAGELLETVLDNLETKNFVLNYVQYCEEVGIYKLKVKAMPQYSADYTQSKYSEEITIIKLGAPTQFTLTETASQKPGGAMTISLKGVSQGAQYKIFLDGTDMGSTTGGVFRLPKPLSAYAESVNGEYIINVSIQQVAVSTSVVNNTVYIDSDADKALTFTLKQLAVPSDIKLGTNNELTWNGVENASGYGVSLSGANYLVSTNKWALPSLAENTYELRVFARGDVLHGDDPVLTTGGQVGEDKVFGREFTLQDNLVINVSSEYSNHITVKKLATVGEITVASNAFNWNGVIDAQGYRVQFAMPDQAPIEYTYSDKTNFNGIYTTPMAPVDSSLDFTNGAAIRVRALGSSATMGDDTEYDGSKIIYLDGNWSSFTSGTTFFKLSTPTGLRMVGETLSWNGVYNMTQYEVAQRVIAAGGSVSEYTLGRTTGTSLSLSALPGSINDATYEIVVRALGDGQTYFDSSFSEPLSFRKLKTVELVPDEEKGAYVWEYQEGVERYVVTISSNNSRKQYNVSPNDYKDENGSMVYKPEFDGATNPTISVYAVGKEGYSQSQTVSFLQKTKRLDAPVNPQITCVALSASQLKISALLKNPLGKGYTYNVAGTRYVVQEGESCIADITSPGTISVKVGYMAEIFHKEGNEYFYYYSSNISENAVSIKFLSAVTIVETVEKEPIAIDNNTEKVEYTVRWSHIQDAQYRCSYQIIKVEDNSETIVYSSSEENVGDDEQYCITLGKDAITEYIINGNNEYKIVVYVRVVGNNTEDGAGTRVAFGDPVEKIIALVP